MGNEVIIEVIRLLRKLLLVVTGAFVLLVSLYSQTPSPFHDVFNYDLANKKYPVFGFELVSGPDSLPNMDPMKIFVIGDVADPYSRKSTVKVGGSTLTGSWIFAGVLRFYGQVPLDNSGNPESYVKKEDYFSRDLEPIFGGRFASKKECQDPNCSYRQSFTPHSPHQNMLSGSKHYFRWGGIDDNENNLSYNIRPDKSLSIWKKIKYMLSLQGPRGISFPPNSGDFSQPRVQLYNDGLLDYPYTKDIRFALSLDNLNFNFPVPFQDCYPGPNDEKMLNDNNTYQLTFKLDFPYVKWDNNNPLDTSVTPVDSGWITFLKARIFVWDARPPEVEIVSSPSTATTGDPFPDGRNIVEFKVKDDNPNQKLNRIEVILKTSTGREVYSKTYEGDELKKLYDSKMITEKRRINNVDMVDIYRNYVADCKIKLPIPPNRKEAINHPEKYCIIPSDYKGTLLLSVNVEVKYGLPDVSDPTSPSSAYVYAESGPVSINVEDNDPPTIELKFAGTKSAIQAYWRSNTPIDKKSTGITVGEVSEDYCLDLNSDQTPLKISIYRPNMSAPISFDINNYFSIRGARQPGQLNVGIDLAKDVSLTSGKTLDNLPALLIEDNRYFFVIYSRDNCSHSKDIFVTLQQESNSLTLGLKGSSSAIPVTIVDSAGNPIFRQILFPNPDENTYVKLRAEDESGNYINVELPLKILNSVMNWTSLEY